MQRSSYSDQVNQNSKTCKTIKLSFNVTNTAFVDVSCFNSSRHEYDEPFLQGYFSCLLHGTLHKQRHPGSHYSPSVTLVSFYFHALNDTLPTLFVYILLISIYGRK